MRREANTLYFPVRVCYILELYPFPLTHLHRVDSSTTTLWSGLFPIAGCLVSFITLCVMKIPIINANNVEPDQMQQSSPVTLLGVSRLKKSKILGVNSSNSMEHAYQINEWLTIGSEHETIRATSVRHSIAQKW